MLPNSVKNLIDNLKNLPGIGNKSAERLAFSMIDFEKKNLTSFSDAILEIRDKIQKCRVCGNISDQELCSICSNKDRDFSTIFVVEKVKDIILFEKLGVSLHFTSSNEIVESDISALKNFYESMMANIAMFNAQNITYNCKNEFKTYTREELQHMFDIGKFEYLDYHRNSTNIGSYASIEGIEGKKKEYRIPK